MVTTACLRPIRPGLRHATRFVEIGLCRPAGLDGAEAAVPGADAAEDHERGRAKGPALTLVRAASLLADV